MRVRIVVLLSTTPHPHSPPPLTPSLPPMKRSDVLGAFCELRILYSMPLSSIALSQ